MRSARMREADLANHLVNDKDPNAEKKPEAQPEAKADEKKDDNKPPARIEFGTKEDFQFQQALNLLKGQPVKGEKSKEVPGPKTADIKK